MCMATMRTTEERCARIAERCQKRRIVRWKRRAAALYSLCLCVILGLAAAVAGITARTVPVAADGVYASLIDNSPFCGYMLIALLSFVLGVCATLLLIRLRRREKRQAGERENGN